MTYQYDVKIDGKWYAAGEEISPAVANKVEDTIPSQEEIKTEPEKIVKRGRPRKD